MLHKMKLNESPFERIKNGTKTIEFRLFDDKRQQIKVGDKIEFLKLPDLQEKLLVDVVELYREDTFENLFRKLHTDEDEIKRKTKAMYSIYSLEKEKEYGVLGIRISLISSSFRYTYNKLVRDKIPEVIDSHPGKTSKYRVLNDKEYLNELNKKVIEEANEFIEANSIEELGDLFEVLNAIIKLKGFKSEEIDKVMKEKVEKKGAFENKLFLEYVDEEKRNFEEEQETTDKENSNEFNWNEAQKHFFTRGKETQEDYENMTKNQIKRKSAEVVSHSILIFFIAIAYAGIGTTVFMINPIIVGCIFLVLIGWGITRIVKHYMSIPKFEKTKEEKKQDKILKQITDIIGGIGLAIYFIISFTTMAWHITWIIFIIIGLVNQIVKLIFMLKGDNEDEE